ncbi:hypothetical protein CCR75_007303 [Bremia lactucae]|uniref:Uncharacterized protein n=1 Tax=Bremia lactucae TaxID=4779 RepID=A0A976FI77_BRELC|nr:hypothetical protein CCR75_007303 [Bremia lactucae]
MLRTSVRHLRGGARSFSRQSHNWLSINSEYMSMRGLDIARRVLHGLPKFVRHDFGNPRIFLASSSDEVRSSMYVLSQFPMKTRVDLLEFVQGAEKAALIVLSKLYKQDMSANMFLEQLATPQPIETMLRKPSIFSSHGGHAVLEQLNVNTAAIESMEYTWEKCEDDVKSEWLTIRVQYHITEHVLQMPKDGIEDRRVINTEFAWTFEADVTKSEEMEWGIVAATPFVEKSAILPTIK